MNSKKNEKERFWMKLPAGSKIPVAKSGKNKYHNNKVYAEGKKFDSQAEWRRYNELLMLQCVGDISKLRCQVKFHLLPEITDSEGRVLETAINYYADFVYEQDGKTVVEDVKGFRTPEYRIKRHLMLWIHGIKIREIKVGRDI